jgi:hypothetical protein
MGVRRDPDRLSATDPRTPTVQLGEGVSHIGLVGRRIAQYEVLGFVAAGGMGAVFRARDTQLARTVAEEQHPGTIAEVGALAVQTPDANSIAIAAVKTHPLYRPHPSHYEQTSLLNGQMWMTAIGGNGTSYYIAYTDQAMKGFSFRLVKE